MVRQYAERDLRQPSFGALGGDDQIAALGDDAADADGKTVDRGDHRFRKLGQGLPGGAVPPRQSLDELRDRRWLWVRGFLRSAPAENAPPASSPVNTATLTPGSAAISLHRLAVSSLKSSLQQLRAAGRLSVSQPT
jgi:hypothetical protein